MFCTPPATTRSAVPDSTAWAAKCTACCEEPHCRSTVTPGTDSGSPAASQAVRAMSPACGPTVSTQPKTTSSTSAGSIPVRASRAAMTCAPRSAGCAAARPPPRRPTGVRTASMMYAPGHRLCHRGLPMYNPRTRSSLTVFWSSGDRMRIAYTPEQERLRLELRDYFGRLMTDEVRAAIDDPAEGDYGDGDAYRAVVRQLGAGRLAGAELAAGARRARRHDARPAHLHRRGGDRAGAGAVPDRQHGRADDHAVRHPGAEVVLPAADRRGRDPLLDRLLGAGGRHRPGVAADDRDAATATST